MSKLKLFLVSVLFLNFTLIFSQGQTCNTATPFCDAPGGGGVQFPNNTNNSSQVGPDYGCLGTQPNPAWFFIKTPVAGNYVFDISQSANCGPSAGLDVDFIAWGPFTNPVTACNNLTSGNIEDCSFSPSPNEQLNITGAPAGQYYLILLTNYSNNPGCIAFGNVGTNATDCSITCASVLSGPGIVNFPSTNPGAGTPATPLPATVGCNSGLLDMYATNLSPFGNPITPALLMTFPNNNNNTNAIGWLEGGVPIACFGPGAGCKPLTLNYNMLLQWGYMSPSAVNSFTMCEGNTAQPNMAVAVKDLATDVAITGFTWVDDGSCQTYNVAAGAIKGISTWTSTCGACLTGVTDWGAAQFNPAAASIGSHTITYSFDPQKAGCTTYTSQVVITVTNPYNAAFVTPGPYCASAGCATLTPSNTYTSGVGTWSGTGVTGSTFCPATSGVGSFPVTYTIGTSPTCMATQTRTVVVNANPIANAGSPAVISCTNTSVGLTGSGGTTYSWTGPAGGISSGGNTATPTVTLAGTYTLLVANGTCTNSATVAVTQNTATPVVTSTVNAALNCTLTSVNASATTTTTPVTYNWSGPGITGGNGTGTISVNQGGTYNYTVTSNGCNTFGSQAVSQNTLTPVVTSSASAVLNCTLTSVNASATTTSTPVSYNWSGTGITSAANISTITVNQPGTFNYTVTNTSNGCLSTGSQAVTQSTAMPVVSTATSGVLNCTLTSVNASATTTTTPVSYNWSGTGITSAANISTITVNQPGTFNYTVTNTSNGCSTTGSQAVTQNTTSIAVTTATNGVLNCTLTSVDASATTTSTPVSYNWSGTGITSATTISTITVNQSGTFNYTVTNTSNGCSTTGSQAVSQNTVIPTVVPATSGVLNCTLTSVDASATTTTTPVSYNWSGTGITSATNISTITVNQGGTFNYTVTNTSNGCSTTGSQVVTQNTTTPTTTASTTGSITCVTNTISLNSTLAGMNYTWTAPGGSSVISGASLQNAVGDGLGTYTLTVLNSANSCTFQTSVAAIQNITAPTFVNAGSDKALVCVTPTLTLDGSASPGAIFNWIGSVSNSAIDTTTTGAAGVFTLQAIEPTTGCFIWDTVRVTQSILQPNVTSNPVTNSITCTNSVVTIGISVSCVNSYSVAWTSGTGISGPTTYTFAVNNPSITTTATLTGVYQATVTDAVNGCIMITAITVTDNITPVIVGTTPASSITCFNPTETLNITPVGANYTYTWTSSGIISGGSTTNPVVNTGGDYSVTVTNTVNGCTGTGVLNVPMDITTPTVSITSPTVQTTCGNPTVTLNVTSIPSTGVTYSWTAPGTGSLNSSTISNPIASGSGIFTVVVTTTANGCSSSLTQNTVEVIPDAVIPNVVVTTNSLSITCLNPTPSTTVSSSSSPVSYAWTPTLGIVPGTETTATPSFSAPGNYSVVVNNTTSGCASDITQNVVTVTLDNIAPSVSLTTAGNSGIITCTNTVVSITPVITPSVNLTYTWSPAAGISTPVNQLDATFIASGIYTLEVTNTLTGCVSTTTNSANTFTVTTDTIRPTATINVTSTNAIIGCGAGNSSVTFSSTITSSNATIISWLPGGAPSPTLDVTSADVYTLVVVDAVNSCSATAQFTVDGSTTPPQNVDAGTLVSIPCGSLTVALNGTTTSTNVSYTWTGPSATSIVSGGSTANPSVNEVGDYTLTVTDNLTSCTSTAAVNVSQGNVTAIISADPTKGLSPLPVSFTCTSTGATNYSWSFGDGNISASQNPVNIFTTGGTYTVILTASSGPCSSTATVVIIVEDGLTLEIPNVFTPNNDGSNDIFTIKSTGIKEISLQIFNRWGQKLYEFTGPKASWDGLTPQGGEIHEGTYFYFVKATGFDEKVIEKNGTVNLFR